MLEEVQYIHGVQVQVQYMERACSWKQAERNGFATKGTVGSRSWKMLEREGGGGLEGDGAQCMGWGWG